MILNHLLLTLEWIESLSRPIEVVEESSANLSQIIDSSRITLELNHSAEVANVRSHVAH